MGQKGSTTSSRTGTQQQQQQQQQQSASRQRGASGSTGQRAGGGRSTGSTTTGGANGGTAANNNNNMPQYLADQYNNNSRQQRAAAPQQQQTPAQQRSTQQQTSTTTNTNSNERGGGVQEGQMVKTLATIEASTVSYVPSTQLLTFYITSTCQAITYEIHTGVKEFVRSGGVYYMPNKPKMEPTRTAIESPQENRKITVKLDISKLEEKEKVYNKHYPKQIPCVVVVRYRTTELRQKEADGGDDSNNNNRSNNAGAGEEVVVEHSEHTAVDLAEKPKRRVISQIVCAGGSAYVVENLYGADTDNAGAGGSGDNCNEVMLGSTIVPHEGEEDEDGLCVICLTNPKDTAVMPCRHMCMCRECGEQLLKHKPVCPVCRAPISTLLHMPTINQSK